MNVGIIIPSFNHFEYVHLACESAAKTPGAVVIIIDDASPQWPGDRIVRGYFQSTVPFVIRRYDQNAGLSRSWNAGLRICRDMAAAHHLVLPVIDDALKSYAELMDRGHGDEDISAIYRLQHADAGA